MAAGALKCHIIAGYDSEDNCCPSQHFKRRTTATICFNYVLAWVKLQAHNFLHQQLPNLMWAYAHVNLHELKNLQKHEIHQHKASATNDSLSFHSVDKFAANENPWCRHAAIPCMLWPASCKLSTLLFAFWRQSSGDRECYWDLTSSRPSHVVKYCFLIWSPGPCNAIWLLDRILGIGVALVRMLRVDLFVSKRTGDHTKTMKT